MQMTGPFTKTARSKGCKYAAIAASCILSLTNALPGQAAVRQDSVQFQVGIHIVASCNVNVQPNDTLASRLQARSLENIARSVALRIRCTRGLAANIAVVPYAHLASPASAGNGLPYQGWAMHLVWGHPDLHHINGYSYIGTGHRDEAFVRPFFSASTDHGTRQLALLVAY